MNYKKVLIVKFDIEGSHNWPAAPDRHKILKSEHQHIFHFEVEVDVVQSDREIEFLDFRREMIQLVYTMYNAEETQLNLFKEDLEYQVGSDIPIRIPRLLFGARSCEMIAEDIIASVNTEWNTQLRSVTVMEDAFVGARLQIDELEYVMSHLIGP